VIVTVVQQKMIDITNFNPVLEKNLPETHALLLNSGLSVHNAVDLITLHGSRGPLGGARFDSDIDLCLVINEYSLSVASDREILLRKILNTTLDSWHSKIKVDLAAVFDKSKCGLRCLNLNGFDINLCHSTVDCLGLFKIQRGFDGIVSGPFVDCRKMYPFMTIWENINTAQQLT